MLQDVSGFIPMHVTEVTPLLDLVVLTIRRIQNPLFDLVAHTIAAFIDLNTFSMNLWTAYFLSVLDLSVTRHALVAATMPYAAGEYANLFIQLV